MLSVGILNRSKGYIRRTNVSLLVRPALMVRPFSSNLPMMGPQRLPVPPPKGEQKKTKSLGAYVTIAQNSLVNGVKGLGAWTKDVILHPSTIPARWSATWIVIKKEAHHYWLGSKLLAKEVNIATNILGRVTQGHGISRRERAQLMRTTVDLFRLIPFIVIMLIPFMELMLPLILKVFPNMLPSTFEDSVSKEMKIKAELQSRLSVAEFFQETMKMMADKVQKNDKNNGSVGGAQELLDFMAKAQRGEKLPTDQVVHIARMFQDELTLPNLPHAQLVMMCKYMGLPTYGSSGFLRFQLRSKLRSIKEDDQRIMYEGLESLDKSELQEACRVRGMRGVGLTSFHLRHQLNDWLVLSMEKEVPIFMLIMSRSMMLTTQFSNAEDTIVESLSKLRPEIVNEVALAAAKSVEEDTAEIQQRKLESLKFQAELIANERVGNNKPAKEKEKSLLQRKGESLKESITTSLEEARQGLDSPHLDMGFGLQGRSLDLEVAETESALESAAAVAEAGTPAGGAVHVPAAKSLEEPTYGYGGETPADVDVDVSISDLVDTKQPLRDAITAGTGSRIGSQPVLATTSAGTSASAEVGGAPAAAPVPTPTPSPTPVVTKKSPPTIPSIFSISAPARVPIVPEEEKELPLKTSALLDEVAATAKTAVTAGTDTSVTAASMKSDDFKATDAVSQEVETQTSDAVGLEGDKATTATPSPRKSNAATVRQFQGLVQGMLLRIQARVDAAEKELAAQKAKGDKDKSKKAPSSGENDNVGSTVTTSALTTDVVNEKPMSVFHTVHHKKSDNAAPVPFEAYIPYTSNSSLQLTPQEMEGALVSILSEIDVPPAVPLGLDGTPLEEEDQEDDLGDIKEELQEMIKLIAQTPLDLDDASPEEIAEAVVTAAEGPDTASSHGVQQDGMAVSEHPGSTEGTAAAANEPASTSAAATPVYDTSSDDLPYLTADYDPATVEKVIEFHRNLRKRKHGYVSPITSVPSPDAPADGTASREKK